MPALCPHEALAPGPPALRAAPPEPSRPGALLGASKHFGPTLSSLSLVKVGRAARREGQGARTDPQSPGFRRQSGGI